MYKAKYRIQGGRRLAGRIRASGNKNAALPCIAASILTHEPVILRNIPNIEDVHILFDILRDLGGNVSPGPRAGEFRLCMANIHGHRIAQEQAEKIRASVLLAGPLLVRMGAVVLPPPGGDVIGRRRIDTHILALSALGAHVRVDQNYSFTAKELCGSDIFLDESSVTATENAIMAAACAKGRSIIRNAASEPHIQDLCQLINAMGGSITGIGSNILTIDGVEVLHGAEFSIGSDYMEIGSFIGLAAATKSSLSIEAASPKQLRMIEIGFAKLGVAWEVRGEDIHIPVEQELTVQSDLGAVIPKIDDAPWPGFPPDLLSIVLTVATQAKGSILIHEKMFESRMFFVDKLISMGAGIVLCDPHRAVVSGPSRLHGADLVSPDVRAGMALVIAALAAEGQSVIQNIYQIERGYENLVERLRHLGAEIERIE